MRPSWTVYSCHGECDGDDGVSQGVFEVWEVGEEVLVMDPDSSLMHLERVRSWISFVPDLIGAIKRRDYALAERIVDGLE